MVVAFAFLASYFGYMKYISFHSSVFDLGVSAYLIQHALQVRPIAFNKLIYILIYPFYSIDPNPYHLIVFQDFMISAGSIPIFFISYRLLNRYDLSLILSAMWLIYFPLSGVEWFDFHFMALFPTFFLAAYALLLYNHYRASIVVFYLAAITDYMAPLIILMLLIVLLFKRQKIPRYVYYSLLFPFMIVFVLVNIFAPSYTLASINIHSLLSHPQVFYSLWKMKILYYLMIGLPFLFSAYIVPEALMIIPYFALSIIHGYQPYVMPILYQYPSLIAPALFIGAIQFISKMNKKNAKTVKPVVVAMLSISIITFVLFTPYGNLLTNNNHFDDHLNYFVGGDYQTKHFIEYKIYDKYLYEEINMIPVGSSVAVENNMPQLVSHYDFILPMNSYNGSPQYILVDPYTIWFYNTTLSPGAYTFYERYVNEKLASGSYGILSEMYGTMLLKYGYNGSIVSFIPYSRNLSFAGTFNLTLAPGVYIIYSDEAPFSLKLQNATIYEGTNYELSVNIYETVTIRSNTASCIYIRQTSP